MIALPEYCTISRGQRFSDLLLLQCPRLLEFVRRNPKKFRYDPFRNEEVYIGFDWVIP